MVDRGSRLHGFIADSPEDTVLAILPLRHPLEAVVFDLDDTLISTRRLYTQAYLDVLEPYLGRRLTVPELAAMKPGPETFFLPAIVAAEAAAACLESFYRFYETLHSTYFEGVYPGVRELLSGLAERRVKTAVFTGKSRRAWDVSARFVGLSGVDHWVFGDEVDRAKPAPDGVLAALAKLDVAPDRAAYVGDSPLDIAAARAAGVLPVAALWPRVAVSKEDLVRLTAEAGGLSLERPDQLLALIDGSGQEL